MSFLSGAHRAPFARNRVADQIFDDLKSQIIRGVLQRGSKLPTEKEMAEHYHVSAPTVREAIRGLSVSGLIDVRHGSGAYVTASSEAIVSKSLSAVIQLETAGVADTLDLLKVLNTHAAVSAARQATEADIRRLREAAEALMDIRTPQSSASAVRTFHHALALAAHNPLLEMICGFLANVQVALAEEISGGAIESWRTILEGLQKYLAKLVDGIERHDEKQTAAVSNELHTEAMRLIMSLPKAQQMRITDPQLAALLSSVVRAMD